MEVKKFKEIKKEKIESAKETLNIIEQVSCLGSLTTKMKEQKQEAKEILENPTEFAKKEVELISDMAAEIKKIGLEPDNPIVENWAKKDLGIGSPELEKILESNSTPKEVKKEILKKMEAPKELIENAIKEKNKTKMKK